MDDKGLRELLEKEHEAARGLEEAVEGHKFPAIRQYCDVRTDLHVAAVKELPRLLDVSEAAEAVVESEKPSPANGWGEGIPEVRRVALDALAAVLDRPKKEGK